MALEVGGITGHILDRTAAYGVPPDVGPEEGDFISVGAGNFIEVSSDFITTEAE